MMEPFEIANSPRIVFGRGSFSRIGELCSDLGRVALVVTNAGEPGDDGPVDRLAGLLSEAGLRAIVWEQRGEPEVEHIDGALHLARSEACDVVIGLGGGSAVDTAKAVAGLLANGGSPLDYMEVVGKGRPLSKPAVPWIAVPTTAGTGAEVTRNAVIGCREPRFKASLRSHHLLARIALVDAELGVNVPVDVTASSGMDALCQLIESYTSRRAQPVMDALAQQGMTLAARSLRRACEDGKDVSAREDMALAALLSGMTLANAGLGAVHGFAAPMGANLSVPHGTVCAALLPHVMQANVAALKEDSPQHPWLKRYATIGRTLNDQPDLPVTAAINDGIGFTADLVEQLQIPSLREFGLTPDQIPNLVGLAQKASSMRYNPVVLSETVLRGILEKAI